MKPFFTNRVSEILRLRLQLAELTDLLEPVQHINGVHNPADLGTRGQVTLQGLAMGSTWQQGPPFLLEPYESWHRTTQAALNKAKVPIKECKVNAASTCPVSGEGNNCQDIIRVLYESLRSDSMLGMALQKLVREALSREKLEVSTRCLACVLQAVLGRGRELACLPPSDLLIEITAQILVRAASAASRDALRQGQLESLGAIERGGVVWISRRIRSETLAELLGTKELPVLLSSEPLARAIMSKSHRQYHRRSPQDIAARSRRRVWIIKATRIAKETASKCFMCRAKDRKAAKQIMVSYTYMASKAVSLLPCPGYVTDEFLMNHRFFTGIYGRPRLLYTDHAPSLVKAAGTHDWDDIADAVGSTGTVWQPTPRGKDGRSCTHLRETSWPSLQGTCYLGEQGSQPGGWRRHWDRPWRLGMTTRRWLQWRKAKQRL